MEWSHFRIQKRLNLQVLYGDCLLNGFNFVFFLLSYTMNGGGKIK